MATVCRADEYHLPYAERDDGGWDVCDKQETLRCLIRVTEVYNVHLDAIPRNLWRGIVESIADLLVKISRA